MISVEGGEEARITHVVLSFQQGLQLSPGKCRFFPVEGLWIPHSSPQAGAAPQSLAVSGSLWCSNFCLSVPLFGVLIEAFKGFLYNLYLGKANPKQPSQKPHSGYEYKTVSGNLPQSKIIPSHISDPHYPLFITYKVLFSVFHSIQTLKRSKSLLVFVIFQRRELEN